MSWGRPRPYSESHARGLEKGQTLRYEAARSENFRLDELRNERESPGAYVTIKVGTVWVCVKRSLARTFEWRCEAPSVLACIGIAVTIESESFLGITELTFTGYAQREF